MRIDDEREKNQPQINADKIQKNDLGRFFSFICKPVFIRVYRRLCAAQLVFKLAGEERM
jgi:hypothetical protein